MEKSEIKVKINEERVKAATLEIRSMPLGSVEDATCASVFGKDDRGNDIWVATFYDSDEAAVFVQASRTFGQLLLGASVPTPVEVKNGAGEDSGAAAEGSG